MADPVLVVSAEDVAVRTGVPVTDENRATYEAAILDAQEDVAAYLGVPLSPITAARDFAYSSQSEEWIKELVNVTSVEYESLDTGAIRVTVVHGYDAANDPTMGPIRKYVRTAAMAQPGVIDMWGKTLPVAQRRRIKSASTDGQSVTYEYLAPDGRLLSDVAKSAIPTLGSLDYWRVAGRRAYQRPGFGSDPLPVDGYVSFGGYW